MAADQTESVSFETTLLATGNNTGIPVPDVVVTALGHGKRPPVQVEVNGYDFRSTIGSMGGRIMISFSAAHRTASGLAGGDPISVTLRVAEAPREVVVPDDFAAAMETAGVRGFFDGLANSLQRYHLDNIDAAKAAETRQRRIDKAVDLFAAGRKR